MEKDIIPEDKFSKLRKQAKELLDKDPSAIEKMPPGEIKTLIEELHIHQTELEMQNEELRRTQLELEAARDKYSNLYDFAPVGYITTSEGLILEANLISAALLGMERSFLIGKPFSNFIARDYQDGFYFLRKNLIETKTLRTSEVKLVKNDGTQFYAQLDGIVVKDTSGNITQTRIAITDITERKRAEEALRESEEQLTATLESTADGILVVNEKGQAVRTNARFIQMWQIPEELVKTRDDKKILDFVLDQLKEPEAFLAKVQTLYASLDEDFDILNFKDGRVFERFSSSLVRDGKIAGRVWSFRDISDRRQAEAALKESEEKYRSIMESMKDEAYICSSDFRIQYMNPATVSRIGRDATGELCHKAIYALDEQCSWCRFEKVLQGENIEYELLNPNNNRYYSLSNSPIHHMDGLISKLTVCRDITEVKMLESQLLQTQKMEALAVLAGGIAHQFNNALSPITGSLDLLTMDYPNNESINNYVEHMRDSAHRMANLTDQLLAYVRGGKYQAKIIALNDFVRNTLPLIGNTLKPSIYTETDLSRVIFNVKADLTQMQSVLSAILSNSSEAIEDKGRIQITCKNKMITDETVEDFPGLKPGNYVNLSITDDGKGMDEDTRSRVFEPFFTTKFQGRGLGMAAAYGIIKNHDGWIFVDSELGKGTTVRIFLPAIEAKVKELKKPKIEPAKGTGTILVIEDEKSVMDVTRAILERMGYSVLEAKTGQEAIEVVKTFDGDIDLAMLDILLPDMRGNAIYPFLMEARPDLKVLVFSGYSIDGPAQEILNAGAQDFIQKPFTIAALSEKLSDVLGD